MNAETPKYRCRALCVDISETMRRIIGTVFESMGVEMIGVATIKEAQHLVDTDGLFIILTTCVYGVEGDVLHWAADVRRDHPGMVMIARSGHVPDGLPERAIEAGFDSFLEMPFLLELFRDVVIESLQTHGHHDMADYLIHCYSVSLLNQPAADPE